ncbi:MAG: hypothetical protein QXK47_05790 [Candidatus Bathyarchaeia archaeon]
MKQNETRRRPEVSETILNFALIFRTDLKTFERIRDFLLQQGAQLIYQTKSTEKIFVSRVGSQVLPIKEGEGNYGETR